MKANIYRQNLNRIEIEICTQCNLSCFQCDRSASQAPSTEYMTTKQIAYFIKESVDLNWLWYEIEILGGEPTLHPNLLEIINILSNYLLFNPDCKIIIVSNGFGKQVQKILQQIPSWIAVENTSKKKINQIPFNDFNIAPCDLMKFKNSNYSKGCKIVSECGLGLNRYGFYPCGAGASIDRVFGFDIGIKNLSELNERTLIIKRLILCQYCGHFKGLSSKVRIIQELSSSWIDAYRHYKRKKPILKLYGGDILIIQ